MLLVTGGTGFLGRRVVLALLGAGYRVRCLVRSDTRAGELTRQIPIALRPRAEMRLGRLQDISARAELFDGCDGVVHLAGRLSGSTSTLFVANVIGTRLLVNAALERRVGRFVLMSSLGVYGTAPMPPGSVLDESCPIDPKPHLRDPYSHSKIAQEHVAWDAYRHQQLPLVVLRPGVLFGPGRSFLSGRVGIRVGPLLVRMGGSRIAPYSYVDNCAQAVASAATARNIEGQAFNIVDDQLPTADELFAAYSTHVARVRSFTVPQWAIGSVAGIYERYASQSAGQFPRVLTRYRASSQWKPLQYSNEHAKRVLGWRPAIAFADGLHRTVSALRRHPEFRPHL
jgi:nucleoside-diphosphate-sugar epimerase